MPSFNLLSLKRTPSWAPPLALVVALVSGILVFSWSLKFIGAQLDVATSAPQGIETDGGAPTFDQEGFARIAPRLGIPLDAVGGSATPTPAP